jgi:hypothetical protein
MRWKSQTQCSETLRHITDLLSFGVTVVLCTVYRFCLATGQSIILCDNYIGTDGMLALNKLLNTGACYVQAMKWNFI